MSLALEYGIEPKNMAMGALAGLMSILRQPQLHQLPDSLRYPDLGSIPESGLRDLLHWVWGGHNARAGTIICSSVLSMREIA